MKVRPETPLLPSLAAQPGHLYWRAGAKVAALTDVALPPEVDLHAYAVLLALPSGVAHSQQQLADLLLLSRQTLVHTAADLVARGYVDRRRNPADRRSYLLTRTEAGAVAVQDWAAPVAGIDDRVLAAFEPEEAAELVGLLHDVLAPRLPDDVPDRARGSAAFLITRGHARMHRRFLADLTDLDLEPRDVGSLSAMSDLGAAPQSDLARALGVSGATVVEIADRLEARGLLVRTPDPHDRRARLLTTTAAAPDVLAEALRIARRIGTDFLGPLDAGRRERLLDLLRRFVVAPTSHPGDTPDPSNGGTAAPR